MKEPFCEKASPKTVKIIFNKGICYTCGSIPNCKKPESKSPDGSCSDWIHYKRGEVE